MTVIYLTTVLVQIGVPQLINLAVLHDEVHKTVNSRADIKQCRRNCGRIDFNSEAFRSNSRGVSWQVNMILRRYIIRQKLYEYATRRWVPTWAEGVVNHNSMPLQYVLGTKLTSKNIKACLAAASWASFIELPCPAPRSVPSTFMVNLRNRSTLRHSLCTVDFQLPLREVFLYSGFPLRSLRVKLWRRSIFAVLAKFSTSLWSRRLSYCRWDWRSFSLRRWHSNRKLRALYP